MVVRALVAGTGASFLGGGLSSCGVASMVGAEAKVRYFGGTLCGSKIGRLAFGVTSTPVRGRYGFSATFFRMSGGTSEVSSRGSVLTRE